MTTDHNPTHPHTRDTDAGSAWLTERPSWAAGAKLQTEHVTSSAGEQFWIAYPLTAVRTTLAERVLGAPGRGTTIGDALRMAALAWDGSRA